MSDFAGPLTAAVRDSARRSVLCWLATVDADGQPNVSPKEVWAIADDRHVVVAKLQGVAREVPGNTPEFSDWAAPLQAMVGQRFTIQSVLVIRVTSVAPIVAPSYRFYPDETTEISQVDAALRAYGVQQKGVER